MACLGFIVFGRRRVCLLRCKGRGGEPRRVAWGWGVVHAVHETAGRGLVCSRFYLQGLVVGEVAGVCARGWGLGVS